ncbi:hypothetical protein COO60DRAFT_68264 [Scenedesmus sp. NREL 46B-D3]|nr:hypothetical protein COO60DRAFT_68264 [Scenedesmus sp. NREL 46B-D3]
MATEEEDGGDVLEDGREDAEAAAAAGKHARDSEEAVKAAATAAAVEVAPRRRRRPPSAAAAAAGAAGAVAGVAAATAAAAAPPSTAADSVAALTNGPSIRLLQNLGSSRWVPKTLVETHMRQLAEAPPRTTLPVTLQLVLLPVEAADVSVDTPAQRVMTLRHGVTVRKAGEKGDIYMLAGLALMRSEPVRKGWYLRCGCRGVGRVKAAGLRWVGKRRWTWPHPGQGVKVMAVCVCLCRVYSNSAAIGRHDEGEPQDKGSA